MSGGDDLPVVLLHGAGDDSAGWEKIGTLHLVAAMGHRVAAIDLPGESPFLPSPSTRAGANLQA